MPDKTTTAWRRAPALPVAPIATHARVVFAWTRNPPGLDPRVGVHEEKAADIEIIAALMAHRLRRLRPQLDEGRAVGMLHRDETIVPAKLIRASRVQDGGTERELTALFEAV